MGLSGKIALVTGASRGIGAAIARKLAADGAFVVVHYGNNGEAAAKVLAEIEAAGGQGVTLGADFTDLKQIEGLFTALDSTLAERGTPGLDILVNNAGIGTPGDLASTTEAVFDGVFDVNVKALLFVTQHAVTRLRDGGRIINISSMVGHNAYPSAVAYAATKAAVDSITVSLAAGFGARGITVNAVAPGATDTDFIGFIMGNEAIVSAIKGMTVLGDIGKPGDIAKVVAFLASDAASWITGERIRASGGMHL